MIIPKRDPNYVPPVTIYTGPHPPTVYNPNWQKFTNLLFTDVQWFMARPEWAAYVATQPVPNFTSQSSASSKFVKPI